MYDRGRSDSALVEDVEENKVLTIYELAERLTGKQRLFAKEFVLDLNATQAAIRAGYSENSAADIGHENLSKPKITQYIDALRSDLSYATGITEHMVLMEHKKIAFTDVASLYNSWGSLKPLEELTDDQKAIIQQIEVKDGDVKLKGYDKKGSLNEIAKILGFYAPTKQEVKQEVEHSGTVTLDDYA